jgi:TatD DNase family protein
MIIDSHCHLDFKELHDDLDAVLSRAARSGVVAMQTICTKISEFNAILAIAELRSNIFCSIGTHPMNVHEEPLVQCADILRFCEHKKVIGIGETGLDYHYNDTDKERQQASFAEHIKAAQESGLPIIVHTRDADEDTVLMLKEAMNKKLFSGVIHCFTASQWLADECLDMGLYISASGIVTFKNAKSIQQTFAHTPLDRIIVETDAPFLAPMPHRGNVNEPSLLPHTVKFLADLRGQDYETFAATTISNFLTLFKRVRFVDEQYAAQRPLHDVLGF